MIHHKTIGFTVLNRKFHTYPTNKRTKDHPTPFPPKAGIVTNHILEVVVEPVCTFEWIKIKSVMERTALTNDIFKSKTNTLTI